MVKLFSKNSNLCDHNSPPSQTDRQTDRRHAIAIHTALCTKVHRAVKKRFLQSTIHVDSGNLRPNGRYRDSAMVTWRVCWKASSLFRIVLSLTPTTSPSPKWGIPNIPIRAMSSFAYFFTFYFLLYFFDTHHVRGYCSVVTCSLEITVPALMLCCLQINEMK